MNPLCPYNARPSPAIGRYHGYLIASNGASNHSACDGPSFLPPIRSSLLFHRCVALAQPPLMLGTKPLRPCLIRDRASAMPRTISTTTFTTAHTIYTVHICCITSTSRHASPDLTSLIRRPAQVYACGPWRAIPSASAP